MSHPAEIRKSSAAARQQNRDVSKNPANPNHRVENGLRYLGDGTLVADDDKWNSDINEILNLNVASLKNNRRQQLDGFTTALGKLTGRIQWERLLQEWSGERSAAPLKEYCQVIVYWLQKRMRRP